MSVAQYRRELEGHQREIAKLQSDKAKEAAKAASDRKKANDASAGAAATKSLSLQKVKLKDAAKYEASALASQKKMAEIDSKIAKVQIKSLASSKRLAEAERQADRKLTQERQRIDRAGNQEISNIRGKLAQHAELHDQTFSTLRKLQTLPVRLKVLFFAANPLDQQQLRLDEEVRLIGEMIRKSEHRDSVILESRWAVRPLDVMQALNEFRPTIVHFSGHGSAEDEIVLQGASGNAKFVTKEAIVQTMMVGSDDIELVFFNTCYSRNQAEAVVSHVPAAIGMNTTIGDEAARVFAAQFYSSIGFGLSVGRAFNQAIAALMLEGIAEESTPELFVGEGYDADQMFLVKPRAEE